MEINNTENGIPMGPSKMGRKPLYPFCYMRVGDKIFFPDNPNGSQSRPAKAAAAYGRRHIKFFSSEAKDGGVVVKRIG